MSQTNIAAHASGFRAKRAETAEAAFCGFCGVDRRFSPAGKHRAGEPAALSELENFRVLPGGTLEKRPGSRVLARLPDRVRTAEVLYRDGHMRLCAVTGDAVFEIDPDEGTVTPLGTIAGEAAHPFFFSFGGERFLLDGKTLYREEADGFCAVNAYVPLYGDELPVEEQFGFFPVKEPRNLLSPYLRFRYRTHVGTSCNLYPPYPVRRVVAAFAGGQEIPASDCTLMAGGTRILVRANLQEAGVLELVTEPEDTADPRAELARLRGSVSLEERGEHLFLFGETPRLYALGNAAEEALAEQHAVLPRTFGALYLPEDSGLYAPQCGGAFRGSCRRGADAILFSDGCSYRLSVSGGTPSLTLSDIGFKCVSDGAVTEVLGDPVLVSENGIYRLIANRSSESGYRPVCLTLAIGVPEFSAPERLSILYHPPTGELVFSDPAAGTLSLCRMETGAWYVYTTDAEKPDGDLFSVGGKLGWVAGDCLVLTDPTRYDDEDGDGGRHPIRATAITPWIGFDTDGTCRTSAGFTVLCEPGEEGVLLGIETDGGVLPPFRVAGSARGGTPELLSCSTDPGRFRFLRAALTADGAARTVLYAFSVTAGS